MLLLKMSVDNMLGDQVPSPLLACNQVAMKILLDNLSLSHPVNMHHSLPHATTVLLITLNYTSLNCLGEELFAMGVPSDG